MLHFCAKFLRPVDIAAYLQPKLLSHLAVVAGGKHRILASESWDAVGLKIRTQPIDLAVLDPMADGQVRGDAILALLDEFPSVPVILYSHLTPEGLQATVDLARAGVRHVILYRYDDGQQRFLELIESQPGAALAQMLLEQLRNPMDGLSVALRRTVERLFGAPGHFTDVPAIARDAKVSKRTLYRGFEDARLASPWMFLSAARLLRAYAYMLEPGNTLEIAGDKLDLDPAGFRRLVRQFFDCTPQHMKRGVPPEEMVATLAKQLCPGLGNDPRD